MKKFLSLILALTLVVSLCAVNVMAASKAHTITLSADKTTDLKAGDKVCIEIKMDNTEGLVSCKYILSYNKDAFLADTTQVNRLDAYIDSAWMSGIKDSEGDWAYYLGAPTYTPKNKVVGVEGEINFGWAGADPVEDGYDVDDRVIGKFYLTVKDGAADGDYTFSLTGTTMDGGENSTADMVCEAITVTVGAAGNDVVDPELDDATVEETDFVNALAVKTIIKPGSATNKIGVLFIPALVLGSDELVAETATVKAAAMDITVGGDVAIELTAAIKDIPYALNGATVQMVTRPFAYDGQFYSYGAQEVKDVEVNF